MIALNKVIDRALDLAGRYRRRREKGTATDQDLVDLTTCLADGKAAADTAGDPAAAFVLACIACGVADSNRR